MITEDSLSENNEKNISENGTTHTDSSSNREMTDNPLPDAPAEKTPVEEPQENPIPKKDPEEESEEGQEDRPLPF